MKAKELNNQIIFYRNNKIDTPNSKFYRKEYISKNKTIVYKFYCSKSSNELYSAKVNIGIISDKNLYCIQQILNVKGFEIININTL